MPGLESQGDLDVQPVEPPDHICFSEEEEEIMVVDDGVEEEEFVERDPSGRYVRYREVLGKGAMKTVYRAYDRVDCKEVAWNQAKQIDCGGEGAASVEREVHILRSLNHKGIIKLYSDWVDLETGNTNFITELCSATLLGYRMKHKHASRKAVKSWGRQILSEIAHLHAQNPPIIHRDLKCENIFVKCSANCTLKIGDFGSATRLDETKHLHTLVGTPEFMAPEMYQEDYNELVDVYSFGMCMLELLTRECPYSECKNLAEIYKKVISGVKPESLSKVKDVQALRLINRCLLPVSERPSAIDLLSDPFFQLEASSSSSSSMDLLFLQCDHEIAHMESSRITADGKPKSLSDMCGELMIESSRITADDEPKSLSETILASDLSNISVVSMVDSPENASRCLVPVSTKKRLKIPSTDLAVNSCKSNVVGAPQNIRSQRHFEVTGYVENETTIRLQLRIQQSGRVRDIMFPFDVIQDSPASVAEELVRTLEYPESDMVIIADLMATEIQSIAMDTHIKLAFPAVIGDDPMIIRSHDDVDKGFQDPTNPDYGSSIMLHKANEESGLQVASAQEDDFCAIANKPFSMSFNNLPHNNKGTQYDTRPSMYFNPTPLGWPPHGAFFISSPLWAISV